MDLKSLNEQAFYIQRDGKIIGMVVGYVHQDFQDMVALPPSSPIKAGDKLIAQGKQSTPNISCLT